MNDLEISKALALEKECDDLRSQVDSLNVGFNNCRKERDAFRAERNRLNLLWGDAQALAGGYANENLRLQAQLAAAQTEVERLKALAVMEFNEDEVPSFTQGYHPHELTTVVTADRCSVLVKIITDLRAQLAAQPVPVNEWKAAVIDALVVAHILTPENAIYPRKAVQDVIDWNCQVALDPRVSLKAQALVDSGKLEPVNAVLVEALQAENDVQTKAANHWMAEANTSHNLSVKQGAEIEALQDDALELQAQLKNASVAASAEAAEVDRMKAEVERLTTLAHGQHIELYNARLQLAAARGQSPWAWAYQCSAGNNGPVFSKTKSNWADSGTGLWTETPLYAAPIPQQPSVPEGWKLVPIEPTEAMLEVGFFAENDVFDSAKTKRIHVWKDMIAAAPQPKETK